MKQKSKKHALTRRQTLGLLGGCGIASLVRSPIDMLLNGLVDGIIQKAQAEATGATPRNYLFFYLQGGPNRWLFDLPLNPYSSDSDVMKHPHINTKFGSTLNPVYATVPITHNGVTLRMPWLWSCNLPTANGGTVPMSRLIDGALFMRGVNMTSDGHELNATRQTRPISSSPSLNGSVADAANTPVPAVATELTPFGDYKSARGVGLSRAQAFTANPLEAVLSPFNRTPDTNQKYLSRRQALESTVDRALSSLGSYANSSSPGAESLFQMRHRAEKLLTAGIGDTMAEYQTLVAKYRGLIRACATTPIPGVSDRAVPYTTGMFGSTFSTMLAENIIVRGPDLRTLIQPDTSITLMAESFAISEYLISRGYSSSVMGGISSLSNLQVENYLNLATNVAQANGKSGYTLDAHFHGSVVALIVESFFYRSFAACLYELISGLKAKNLYDETVIHIGSEFSRIPRADQRGSDHGWSANTVTVFSGAVEKPMVLGNTLRDASNGQAQKASGSWGSGAPVEVDAQKRPLHFGNTAATISELLRIKAPMPNYSSLVVDNGGGLSATIDLAGNKAGS